LKQLQDGTFGSIEELGKASKIHPKNVRIWLRLAFLSPSMTKSILNGKAPVELLLSELVSAASICWRSQAETIPLR
jgi:hypothetical protein